MSTPMPPAPPPPAEPVPSSGHPVQLRVVHQDRYSRGLAVLGIPFLYGRFLALIPVAIVFAVVAIVAFFTAWVMQFAVLFTGRYPAGAHSFLAGLLQLEARFDAWAYGLSDTYPGFSLQATPPGTTAAHPVQLTVAHAETYSRGLAALGCLLFVGRAIALIPVLVVLYFVRIAAFVVAWIFQFAVLFTGRYSEGAHDFVVGYVRLEIRAGSFLFGLTDSYPGFSLQA
jgi:hypothetical protein